MASGSVLLWVECVPCVSVGGPLDWSKGMLYSYVGECRTGKSRKQCRVLLYG